MLIFTRRHEAPYENPVSQQMSQVRPLENKSFDPSIGRYVKKKKWGWHPRKGNDVYAGKPYWLWYIRILNNIRKWQVSLERYLRIKSNNYFVPYLGAWNLFIGIVHGLSLMLTDCLRLFVNYLHIICKKCCELFIFLKKVSKAFIRYQCVPQFKN